MSRDVDGEAGRADGKQPRKGVWILPVKCRRTDREGGNKESDVDTGWGGAVTQTVRVRQKANGTLYKVMDCGSPDGLMVVSP